MALIARDGNNNPVTIASNLVSLEHVVLHSDPNLGAIADTSAASDFGGFSLIALFKRLLSIKLPDSVAGKVPVDGKFGTYGNPTLAITAALSTGIIFDVSKFQRLRMQINNTGANALNGFEVSTRSHVTGDWQIHLNLAAHFTAPTAGSILRHCADLSGAAIDLTTLPASGKSVMAIDLRDFFASDIRVRAASTAGTNMQVLWGAE
jgi:hypothetical protein